MVRGKICGVECQDGQIHGVYAPVLCHRQDELVHVTIDQKPLGLVTYPLFDRPKELTPSPQMCIGQDQGTSSWVVVAW